MRLYLVRHGETDSNVRAIKSVNGMLTVVGRQQVEKLARHLKSEHFDVVYVSDLQRAVDTAAEILKYHPHAKVIHTPYLRERKAGTHYEGQYNRKWETALRRTKTILHEFRPRGGESLTDVQKRAVHFLNQLCKDHVHQSVLIVSHGAALGTLLLHLLGKPLTHKAFLKHLPPNTALSIFEISETGPHKAQLLNSVEHLL